MSNEKPYIAILNNKSVIFIFKNRDQEDKTGPVWGVGTSAKREDRRKGHRRLNMVEILYTHVQKWKNEETSQK
jgi:hypothetical protein